ncbi:hypothetical protein EMPS_05042 [Entomortierella parvispora]|uniref:Uncharacterized protein n=1 Tax=Entomortierella parvispora TaxID=205924 RepID=A0A9P3LW51_9FUNG|nr:hypothetical protein EMPS_05042 [Entomortierella parvispora]
MMRSQLKLVLVAILIALIATMAAAEPKKHTTTTSVHKKHHPTAHHKKETTTTAHHKHKSPKTKTKAHKTTTTTTTKHHKATTTVKPHKSTTTTKPHKSTTTAHAVTTTTKPTVKPTGKPTPTGHPGQVGTIKSSTDFCLWLPKMFGGDIAANEDSAVAFCTKSNIIPSARILPGGFIKSAHFVQNTTAGWVQVTGRLDRSKYGLKSNDGGGQYDMRAPVGAACAGYNSFVQLTEPDAQIYCIRCCMNKIDCPVNKSTHGCEKVLGGNYA